MEIHSANDDVFWRANLHYERGNRLITEARAKAPKAPRQFPDWRRMASDDDGTSDDFNGNSNGGHDDSYWNSQADDSKGAKWDENDDGKWNEFPDDPMDPKNYSSVQRSRTAGDGSNADGADPWDARAENEDNTLGGDEVDTDGAEDHSPGAEDNTKESRWQRWYDYQTPGHSQDHPPQFPGDFDYIGERPGDPGYEDNLHAFTPGGGGGFGGGMPFGEPSAHDKAQQHYDNEPPGMYPGEENHPNPFQNHSSRRVAFNPNDPYNKNHKDDPDIKAQYDEYKKNRSMGDTWDDFKSHMKDFFSGDPSTGNTNPAVFFKGTSTDPRFADTHEHYKGEKPGHGDLSEPDEDDLRHELHDSHGNAPGPNEHGDLYDRYNRRHVWDYGEGEGHGGYSIEDGNSPYPKGPSEYHPNKKDEYGREMSYDPNHGGWDFTHHQGRRQAADTGNPNNMPDWLHEKVHGDGSSSGSDSDDDSDNSGPPEWVKQKDSRRRQASRRTSAVDDGTALFL